MTPEMGAVTLVAALCPAAYFVISGFLRWRSERDYSSKLDSEVSRSAFATIRHRLMVQVSEGELNPRSSTFCKIYWLCTDVMRRTDEHGEISAHWLTSLVKRYRKAPDEAPGATSSHEELPPETVEVLADTIRAMDLLVLRHNPVIRFLYEVAEKAGTVESFDEFVAKVSEKYREKETANEGVRKLQSDLENRARELQARV